MTWFTMNLELVLFALLLLATAGFALSGLSKGNDENFTYDSSKLKKALAVAAVGVVVIASVAFVPAGYRGVVFSQFGGVDGNERGEGIALHLPFVQRVVKMDVRTQVYVADSEERYVHTKDFHEVRVPVAVNYRVDPEMAAELYQNVTADYVKAIIEPAVLQALRTEIGKVRLLDLATSVADVAEGIRVTIAPQLAAHGIIATYVSIEDAIANKEFVQAVNAERIAERKILEAANLVQVAIHEAEAVEERARGEAAAVRIRADAQAEANSKIAATVTPGLIDFERWTRWNGQLPQTLLSGDQDVIVGLR